MKLEKRLERLEAKRPPAPYVPPIFFHSVVEPSENGPTEVDAFAMLRVDGKQTMIWRNQSEANKNFQMRIMAMESNDTCSFVSMQRHE